MDTTREISTPEQYLTFQIVDEEYAVGILRVREIIEYPPVTRVPTAPPWFRGVINLRGSVVPVVDLAVKFGLPPAPVTRKTCVVVTEADLDGEASVLGLVADRVSQVLELRPDDIEPPPSFGTAVRVDYLRGMGKVGSRFALILDLDRVLSVQELMQVSALQTEEVDGEEAVAAAEEAAG